MGCLHDSYSTAGHENYHTLQCKMLYSLVDICENGTGLFSDCLKLKNEGTMFLQNIGHQ